MATRLTAMHISPRQINLPAPKKPPKSQAAEIFSSHSGEVMGFPGVRAVYWGNAYGSQANGQTQLAQSLDNFFASIFPTNYFGLLAEYNVNMPTFLGSVWLPHDPTQPLTVTMDEMKNTVTGWLDAQLITEVPGRTELNLLYIVFLSPEITIAEAATQGACGYHTWTHYHKGSGKDNLFFAVITSRPLAALTQLACHELVEAFTDRSGNGWYSDPTGHEIGDVCDCCGCASVTLNGFSLAMYWRNSLSRCLQQVDLTPPTVTMSVDATLVHKSGTQRTIEVTVTALARVRLRSPEQPFRSVRKEGLRDRMARLQLRTLAVWKALMVAEDWWKLHVLGQSVSQGS
jgi:hypothetical protein